MLCQNRLPDRGERKPTSTDRLWSPISPLLECPYLQAREKALSGVCGGARVTYQNYGSDIGDMAICRHRARMRDRRLSYHETRSPGGARVGVTLGAGVPPALSRLHCPPPLEPWPGRAARAVRGRCGRLRAALWRLRGALSGSTGNGFVSGALLPLVASRAVCVGRIYSGLWRNCG